MGMDRHDNWNFRTYSRLVAYACGLDILLHHQVTFVALQSWKGSHAMWCIWMCLSPSYESRTKMVGPVVKLLFLIAATVVLVLWLIIGVVGSILAGLAYGFLAPVMATFDAVGEGKEKPLVHCFLVQFNNNGFILISVLCVHCLFHMVS